MGRKKSPPSKASKAYLVSFGDTMTALLAFFIVINALAKEQTGANMHAGTGSFVRAFSRSGVPGGVTGSRSHETIQKSAPAPVYGLAGNIDKNGLSGPDDPPNKDRIINRDQEVFQEFLDKLSQGLSLEQLPAITDQTVYDSFKKLFDLDGQVNEHVIQLFAEALPKLRAGNVRVEIIVWATMPSQKNIANKLKDSMELRNQIEDRFWLKPQEQQKIVYRVKPWLFSDARRPVLSVVHGTLISPGGG